MVGDVGAGVAFAREEFRDAFLDGERGGRDQEVVAACCAGRFAAGDAVACLWMWGQSSVRFLERG